ncbi:DUF2147 domain-containing protein [Streptobacillus canis]|uniref:DUF2147 domain-containing protein n=1 Tax=Streptobacillus canis TaxID=2678686 RepID=UPI0012E16BEC|nr:DUF2147 domain-containing protein [Streptobacillus canis]
MKKIFYFLTILLMPLFAMAAKEDAFGRWITETSSAGANRIIVDIYEKNGKVYGKIYQLTERFDDKGELKKDVNNPDKSKQSRTLEGIDFVSGFVYNDSNNTYEDGKIYDPSTGKTYSCYMVLQENGTLKVRGHLPGLTLIGKTQTWKRYK